MTSGHSTFFCVFSNADQQNNYPLVRETLCPRQLLPGRHEACPGKRARTHLAGEYLHIFGECHPFFDRKKSRQIAGIL